MVQDVFVGRVYNVLVSTDKPVYQPGQVIHMRGLALDALDLHAAGATDHDVDGRRPARQQTDAPGRWQRANMALPAPISRSTARPPAATTSSPPAWGRLSSTRSVEVKPYTLPRFEVKFQPDKTFYLPGEVATGKVEARYFFGKPVEGGKVTIRGTTSAAGDMTLFELTGEDRR